MKLMPSETVEHNDFFRKLGPEPLDESFTGDVFVSRMRRRNNSNIKSVLLDQTVLAGIGNIYADESLWGAMIHPSTLVRDVSDEDLEKLHKELIFVLKLSIEKGGSTDRTYVNAEARRGAIYNLLEFFEERAWSVHAVEIQLQNRELQDVVHIHVLSARSQKKLICKYEQKISSV